MKVRIDIAPEIGEDEVIIRCAQLDESIINLQKSISQQSPARQCILLHKADTEYFIPVCDVYFFETSGNEIYAHTGKDVFVTEHKLYELEELLPANFMRVSKSTIANLDMIYSIARNLTASSVVEFVGTSKKTLVSRSYYRALAERLTTRRTGGRV